jgi:DNA-binding NarL/FixJ family response regulator
MEARHGSANHVGMIGVAIVDDHRAVTAGLEELLRLEPDLAPVGVAADGAELAPLVYRARPDVVVLDYAMPEEDGLLVCRRLKGEIPAPGVVLYSAFAGSSLAMPAIVAGADAVVDKAAPVRELLQAIRLVAAGEPAMPGPSRQQLEAASAVLRTEDLPIMAMLVDRTPTYEIAEVLRIAPAELNRRMAGMLGRLRAPISAHR